ncbi:hypothetical protein B0H14DRAFT_2645182 [Mycena olivaceomarginata]|nr:hypothetical protein B0H14DRAFT_2645182 [Mycena olivaceomarginata]
MSRSESWSGAGSRETERTHDVETGEPSTRSGERLRFLRGDDLEDPGSRSTVTSTSPSASSSTSPSSFPPASGSFTVRTTFLPGDLHRVHPACGYAKICVPERTARWKLSELVRSVHDDLVLVEVKMKQYTLASARQRSSHRPTSPNHCQRSTQNFSMACSGWTSSAVPLQPSSTFFDLDQFPSLFSCKRFSKYLLCHSVQADSARNFEPRTLQCCTAKNYHEE